jgi:HEAT repeat protein
MSNGDEEPEESMETAAEDGASEDATLGDRLDATTDALAGDDPAESIDAALSELSEAVELAGTEADLDAVEAATEDVASALEDADLPEPEDDDEDGVREELEARLSGIEDDIEDARGPYAADAIEAIEEASGTIADTRWSEDGESDVVAGLKRFLDAAADTLGESFDSPGRVEGAEGALAAVTDAVERADLDPDADADAIGTLLDGADALAADLEDAEEWDDLTTVEQLRAEGFYDVLDHRKDFPPEWHAIKVWEKRGNAEMVLLALEKLGSEFMEEHCLEALERMGPEEAVDPMLQRANRRDKPAIRILGKIGSEEALDTIEEYAGPDADDALRRVALKAVGEIGSRESTGTVAQGLAADNESVRSRAARALGLIGDTRAVEPLAETLAGEDSDTVRASAAWALVRIGTERALAEASAYADDRSPLVRAEAETAADALGATEAEA